MTAQLYVSPCHWSPYSLCSPPARGPGSRITGQDSTRVLSDREGREGGERRKGEGQNPHLWLSLMRPTMCKHQARPWALMNKILICSVGQQWLEFFYEKPGPGMVQDGGGRWATGGGTQGGAVQGVLAWWGGVGHRHYRQRPPTLGPQGIPWAPRRDWKGRDRPRAPPRLWAAWT